MGKLTTEQLKAAVEKLTDTGVNNGIEIAVLENNIICKPGKAYLVLSSEDYAIFNGGLKPQESVVFTEEKHN